MLRGFRIPVPLGSTITDVEGPHVWLSDGSVFDLETGLALEKAPKPPKRRAAKLEIDGATVIAAKWKSKPFGALPIDEVSDARLDSTGAEVLVRGESWDETGLVRLVARLDAKTGRPIETRRAARHILEAWGPIEGPAAAAIAIESAIVRYVGDARPWKEGALVVADDQLVVLRPGAKRVAVQRIALPPVSWSSIQIAGDRVLAITTIDRATELACIPLPGPDDGDAFDLVLEPRGPATAAPVGGEEAIVTFAGTSAPFVVFEHPKHGRITLGRGPDQPIPQKGDRAILEGIDVSPGVVSARRWSIAGSAQPREAQTFELGPAPLGKPEREKRLALLAPLRARAKKRDVELPSDVVVIVKLAEKNEAFRDALARADVDLDDVDDDDVLAAVGEKRRAFVAIYGNGHGDAFGGLLDGKVVTFDADGSRIASAPDLATAIRKTAKDREPSRRAMRTYIDAMLDGA